MTRAEPIRPDDDDIFARPIVLRPSERGQAKTRPTARRPKLSAAGDGPVRLEVHSFRIIGLTGEDDAERVRMRLARLPGVEDAEVHFSTEHASVQVTDPDLSTAYLREVVRTAGFDALEELGPKDGRAGAPDDEVPLGVEVRRLAVVAVTGVPAWLLDLANHVRVTTDLPVDVYRHDLQLFLTAATVFWGARHLWWRMVGRAAHGRQEVLAGLVEEGPIALAIVLGLVLGTLGFVGGEFLGTLGITAALAVLLQAGRVLEALIRRRMLDPGLAGERILPSTAVVVREQGEFQVRTRHLSVGDLVAVDAGMRVPVGGIIEEGGARVDEHAVTGRPADVPKGVGDSVVAGALVVAGRILVRARRVGSRTLAARIAAMASEMARTKAHAQQVADLQAVGVNVAACVAACVAIAYVGLSEHKPLTHALLPILAVLAAVSTRAVRLAVPLAVAGAMRQAARAGILVRDAAALEAAAEVKAVALGRTGVLTAGRPVVEELRLLVDDLSELEVLRLAVAAENRVRHPVADSLVAYAGGRGVDLKALPKALRCRSIPGQGVVAEVEGRQVAVGNAELVAAQGSEAPEVETVNHGVEQIPLAANFVVLDGRVVAVALMFDPLKEDAARGVYHIRRRRLRPLLVTGEDPPVAQALADAAGIREVYSGIPPSRQREIIAEICRKRGACAAVVGAQSDVGLLEPATVGFLILSESRLPTAEAGVTLLRGTLDGIPATVTIARKMRRIVRENLAGTSVYHALILTMAAFDLVGPVVAASTALLATLVVTANGTRAERARLPMGTAPKLDLPQPPKNEAVAPEQGAADGEIRENPEESKLDE